MHIHIHIHICVYVCVYIYIERERYNALLCVKPAAVVRFVTSSDQSPTESLHMAATTEPPIVRNTFFV